MTELTADSLPGDDVRGALDHLELARPTVETLNLLFDSLFAWSSYFAAQRA